MTNKIVVIGSNMIDLITYIDRMPVAGETIEAPDFEMGFGGKGANQAVAAARLGSEVAMITMVGNDNFGQQQLTNFKKNNIDVTGVGIGTKNSGAAPIFVDASSENRILIIKGANQELTPAVLDRQLNIIQSASLIVLQQEIPLATNYHAIELANQYQIPVLLNPAPANHDLNIEYVTRVDFFTPNETELSTLTGLPTTNIAEIEIAANKLVEMGVKNVIVTLGAKGVLLVNQAEATIIDSIKVKAVDTTGAGDSFIGAFAHYYTTDHDLKTALSLANQYAAVTVTQRGTQKSYPNAEALKQLTAKITI